MIERLKPESEDHWLALRTQDITSTEISALFNLSPYSTYFELWHRKKEAVVVRLEENERMKWGSRLESAIAEGIAEDHGWIVRRMDEYIRDKDMRIGASFDFSIEEWKVGTATPEYEKGLLEIKNVDSLVFRDGWTQDEDGDLEAPAHIELQVQQQLLLTGRPVVHIGALVGGNKVQMIERQRVLGFN
jgi:putative phage-type endonuclease